MIHRFLAQTFHEVVTFVKNVILKASVTIEGNLTVNGTNNIRPYKVYSALLTQSGTDAPIATVLENTLGFDLNWQRANAGNYFADVINSEFVDGKTFLSKPERFTGTVNTGDLFLSNESTIWIKTYAYDAGGVRIQGDNGLYRTSVEVRVYP